MRRYCKYRNLYIIYTNLSSLDREKYPNTFRYLYLFREILEERAQYKQRRGKGEDIQWHEIEQPLDPSILEKPKIATQRISNQYGFAFVDRAFYTLETCSTIIPKDKDPDLDKIFYILGLLNSQLMEFFSKTDGKALGKKGYEFEKQFLERLPIKLPETEEEKKIANQIIEKVDEILELHKSSSINIDEILEDKETEKLCSLPGVTFHMKDDARFENVKIEGNKIYINSEDYIEIRDERVRKFVNVYFNLKKDELVKSEEVKSIILNLPVPKSEEVIKEIVNKGSIDRLQIEEKIKKLEDEINDLVYILYGITLEERKIIEENLRA